ncbi:MAG: hypothetical protein IJL57_07660 [Bacteroidales bacterium]|nr:hypothetical protein [Bacteroidales bacterium]MBQ5994183.1 hypothetical protein [Bacteroidales bacterium]
MKTSYPEETAMNDPEYDELLRRALEPFRPTRTMDDVLKREAEIREASLAAFKEEAKRMGKDRRKTETERGGFIPQLDYEIKFDF